MWELKCNEYMRSKTQGISSISYMAPQAQEWELLYTDYTRPQPQRKSSILSKRDLSLKCGNSNVMKIWEVRLKGSHLYLHSTTGQEWELLYTDYKRPQPQRKSSIFSKRDLSLKCGNSNVMNIWEVRLKGSHLYLTWHHRLKNGNSSILIIRDLNHKESHLYFLNETSASNVGTQM